MRPDCFIKRILRRAGFPFLCGKEREALTHHMKAIESCMDGIAILDAEGCYTYVNQAHARCYGYADKNEMIGKSWRDLYAPKHAARFSAEVFPQLDQFGEWSGFSHGRRLSGEEFPQELSLRRLDDGGLICIVRDLTKQAQTEQLTRIIKLAVEAASDGIAITDEDNKLLFMNRSFLKIHGYDPYEREKYIGVDWRDLYNKVGQDHINSVVLPTTILKGSWVGSTLVMRQDGTLFHGDASLTRLSDGLILGVMRDVTDRRQAELEREELREQLFQSQKIEAIGRLTNRLIHDFEAILDAVEESAVELTSECVPDYKRKHCAGRLNEEMGKARAVVEQLTAFTNAGAKKRGHVQVADIVEDIPSQLSLPDGVELLFDIKLAEASIHAEQGRILQVMRNLCRNALESITDREGKIVVTVKSMDPNIFGLRRYMLLDGPQDVTKVAGVRSRHGQNKKQFLMTGHLIKDRSYVQITVSDTGCGIEADILPMIFDPFFTTKELSKGTGLGLATVQGIVVGAGGAIVVETAARQGTSFHLFLPVYEPRGPRADISAA